MKNHLIIIATIIVCLIASMLLLAYTEKNQREENENFWSIYFIEPLSHDNHSFVIDNRAPAKQFTYTVKSGDEILTSGEITVDKNQIISVPVVQKKDVVSVIVTDTHDEERKIIWK